MLWRKLKKDTIAWWVKERKEFVGFFSLVLVFDWVLIGAVSLVLYGMGKDVGVFFVWAVVISSPLYFVCVLILCILLAEVLWYLYKIIYKEFVLFSVRYMVALKNIPLYVSHEDARVKAAASERLKSGE